VSVTEEKAQVNSWAAMEQRTFGCIRVIRVTVVRVTSLLAVSDTGREPDSREKEVRGGHRYTCGVAARANREVVVRVVRGEEEKAAIGTLGEGRAKVIENGEGRWPCDVALDLVEGTGGAVADPGFSRERDAVAEGTKGETAVGGTERDGGVKGSDQGRWEGGNELRANPVREGTIA